MRLTIAILLLVVLSGCSTPSASDFRRRRATQRRIDAVTDYNNAVIGSEPRSLYPYGNW